MSLDDSAQLKARIAELEALVAADGNRVVRVVQPFLTSAKHGNRFVKAGEEFVASDPLVVNRDAFVKVVGFVDADGNRHVTVEPQPVAVTAEVED